ncbi:MAG TPA: 16S rRNA (guanine(527)-N(7))-methyltransferase RsmG [Firmicutes bacterium]|jgi:16S rRNA (guanine527-N7)-methyltransferase|nr:16S rRNA (guanine(527)-N(7))-methyltransferase RsmG [Bacillota bacterium]
MNESQQLLVSELEKISIHLSDEIFNQLFQFIDFLLEVNQNLNLTAITDFKEVLFKHIYDSLIILNCSEFRLARRIIDIGSGAGIPGIPLAISSPEKQFVSLDSVQKKVKFQEQFCERFGIHNINPVWGRAEDFITISKERESFDLAIARAVAPLNILSELTLPFVSLKGYALLYKGKDYQSELQDAQKAIKTLGGSVIHTVPTELPLNYGFRSLVIIQKIQSSPPGYPRKAGIPQRKPL